MLYFKPTPVKAVVATAPAQKKEPVQIKKRYRVHSDGTISPIEDVLDWDFDKPNRAGE